MKDQNPDASFQTQKGKIDAEGGGIVGVIETQRLSMEQ